MTKVIRLVHSQMEITKFVTASYLVSSGSVFLYIITVENEKAKSRLFLKEVHKGEWIPSLWGKDLDEVQYAFGIVAVDEAILTMDDTGNNEELQENFYNSLDIRVKSFGDFSEKIIEIYNRDRFKSELDIYKKSKGIKKVQTQIDELLNKTINPSLNPAGEYDISSSTVEIYDAVAVLCHRKKIKIKPYQEIKNASNKAMTLEEISRISHFVTRKVTLEENWYKNDVGDFLAFLPDETPVAIIKKKNKYYVANPKDKTENVVDSNTVIRSNGYEIYRSFDPKPLEVFDILRFGVDQIKLSDINWYFILMLVVTLFGLLTPYLNQLLFDDYIPYGKDFIVLEVGSVILACSIANILFVIVRNLLKFRCSKKIENAIQFATFDRIFNMPEKFYRDYTSADLTMRTNYVTQIANVFTNSVVDSVISGIFSLIYFFRMITYSGKMSIYALILVTIFILVQIFIGLRQVKYQEAKTENDIKAASIISNDFKSIQQIRNSHVEDRASYEYLKVYSQSKQKNYIGELLSNHATVISGIFSGVVSVVFYYSMIVGELHLTRGEFIGFLSAFGMFANSMTQAIAVILTMNAIRPFMEKLKPIMTTAPEYSEDNILPGKLEGGIEVNNVTFSYNETEGNVLDNFSLKIEPGEYVGIVGSSGCGKSTLLKLLLGFEKPKTGAIYYDNMNIDKIDKRSLRKQLGVVLQDSGIIYGSIYDNIRITHPEISKENVDKVIEQVQLTKDIAQMPMGLQTMLTPDSNTISGGQKQRIMIARALVGKPAILFFDEATSALDNVTQKKISDSLKNMKITKVVIAHRLSTIRDCDRIIVLDKGRIIEEGNYEELMEQQGFFYRLSLRQM